GPIYLKKGSWQEWLTLEGGRRGAQRSLLGRACGCHPGNLSLQRLDELGELAQGEFAQVLAELVGLLFLRFEILEIHHSFLCRRSILAPVPRREEGQIDAA